MWKPVVVLGALFMIAPVPAHAISVGEIDTFDVDLAAWRVGDASPLPPLHMDGGPGGVGDGFMQLRSSGGFGAGSKLVVFAAAPWSGDFVSAGVTSIGMDLRNLGATDLWIRFAIEGLGGRFASEAVFLASGGDWTHHVFDITALDLFAVSGGDVDQTLESAFRTRILHSLGPSWIGDPIEASLGVDNIEALPEPRTVVLVGLALMTLARARERAVRSRG